MILDIYTHLIYKLITCKTICRAGALCLIFVNLSNSISKIQRWQTKIRYRRQRFELFFAFVVVDHDVGVYVLWLYLNFGIFLLVFHLGECPKLLLCCFLLGFFNIDNNNFFCACSKYKTDSCRSCVRWDQTTNSVNKLLFLDPTIWTQTFKFESVWVFVLAIWV